ncbi:MAG: hypothetical protein ACR2PJ_05825 [Pseudomonadales bacterium]
MLPRIKFRFRGTLASHDRKCAEMMADLAHRLSKKEVSDLIKKCKRGDFSWLDK